MGDKYTVVELDTLGGDYSEAFGINKNGQIVGRASRPMVGASACLWQPWSAYDVLGLGAAGTAIARPPKILSSGGNPATFRTSIAVEATTRTSPE